MDFFLIRDIEEEHCNGVIIESEDHQYGARLAGSDGVDDPSRIIPLLISKNAFIEILTGEGDVRERRRFKIGEPGYIEALISKLRTPLVLFRRGRMTEVLPPDKMTLKLWERFCDPDAEIPGYVNL